MLPAFLLLHSSVTLPEKVTYGPMDQDPPFQVPAQGKHCLLCLQPAHGPGIARVQLML